MLTNSLREVASEVINRVNKWREEGKIRKTQRVYVKCKVRKFEYRKGAISCETIFPYEVREEHDLKVVFDLVKCVKETGIFKKASEIIAETYNVKKPQAELWLERLVQVLVSRCLDEVLDESSLVDLIVTFIGDLENNPRDWFIKVWLNGLYLETDELKVDDGRVIIRKPKPSDFEYEYPLDVPPLRKLPRYPSAILEIRKRVKIRGYVYSELEKLLILLQLYKVGSIYVTMIEWRPKSILLPGSTTYYHSFLPTPYTYSLSGEDEQRLSKFISHFTRLLPVDEHGKPLLSNHTGIAILRYQDAILKPEPTEVRIAYSIMGLEALYLKISEKEELSHRLAQRVAKLMSILEHSPVKVYNIIKEAYNIRSNFVHGAPIQKEKPVNLKEILDNVLEYLRISILTFLQVGKDLEEKDRFISLLDHALLEEKALKKLINQVKESVRWEE